MKKILIALLVGGLIATPAYSKTDKTSAEYLKNKKHFSIMNFPAERIAQKILRNLIENESGHDFDITLKGYTLSSMRKGIFKYLEIEGENFEVNDINIVYGNIKTLTDYNWVDYKQNPPIFKTDSTFAYKIRLSEDSINKALEKKEYQKVLDNLNNRAYPLFTMNKISIRLKNNKTFIIMEYNFPLSPMKNDKKFVVSTDFKVVENKIIADNINISSIYGTLQHNKIANLINGLDPLNYTLTVLNTKKCNAKVENVKIIDNLVEIDGKIFVEGD